MTSMAAATSTAAYFVAETALGRGRGPRRNRPSNRRRSPATWSNAPRRRISANAQQERDMSSFSYCLLDARAPGPSSPSCDYLETDLGLSQAVLATGGTAPEGAAARMYAARAWRWARPRVCVSKAPRRRTIPRLRLRWRRRHRFQQVLRAARAAGDCSGRASSCSSLGGARARPGERDPRRRTRATTAPSPSLGGCSCSSPSGGARPPRARDDVWASPPRVRASPPGQPGLAEKGWKRCRGAPPWLLPALPIETR
jgi:hypothetical protein